MRLEQFHVKNQFVLTDDQGNRFFQSYNTIICKIDKSGTVTLSPDGIFQTQRANIGNLFLGEDKKQTQKKINSGEYKIENLN